MKGFERITGNLTQHGFDVKTFETGLEAATYLNDTIDNTTVGIGGSVTAQELNIYNLLLRHNAVYWHWVDGPEKRAQAAQTDIYITSANALAETGEIINIDGVGNRVSSIFYGHKKVYFLIGRNKIALTYEEALWRARNVAAPKNAMKLKRKTPCAIRGDRCYDCKSPDRICKGMMVLWQPMMETNMEVILINEDLGY